VAILVEPLLDREAEAARGPAHVGLEDLADIHAARHAERVQQDVDRRAVGEERHVLLRHHLGDHALVAVAAGHLVAGLELALHRDEDLDHLHHARRQVVAAADLLDLVLEAPVERLLLQLELLVQGLLRLGVGLLAEGELPPLAARELAEKLLVDLRARLDALRPLHRGLAEDQVLQTRIDVALEDGELVVAVAAQALDLLALDLQRALVLVDAVPVEDPHLDDRAEIARRQPERGVAHVGRLLAEDRAEELFLRRHRALALGGDLAHKDVARPDLGADVDDARLVEVAQGLLADIGDVAGDLLRPELGVAGGDLVFLDVDRGEDVVLDDPLGDQDRVLEVVAVPRHEGDEHVLAERELAHVGRGPSAMNCPGATCRPPSPAGAG
jgi:hypothetical protein